MKVKCARSSLIADIEEGNKSRIFYVTESMIFFFDKLELRINLKRSSLAKKTN